MEGILNRILRSNVSLRLRQSFFGLLSTFYSDIYTYRSCYFVVCRDRVQPLVIVIITFRPSSTDSLIPARIHPGPVDAGITGPLPYSLSLTLQTLRTCCHPIASHLWVERPSVGRCHTCGVRCGSSLLYLVT